VDHECDRQTDRQTELLIAIAARGLTTRAKKLKQSLIS